MFATALRLCIAIALVMGLGFGLHQSGFLLQAKAALDPGSRRNGPAVALWSVGSDPVPIVVGDAGFHKLMRHHCGFDRATYITAVPTTFRGLERLVDSLRDGPAQAPVILQLTNETWFPNNKVTEFDFRYMPERSDSLIGTAWTSTGLMFSFFSDIVRRDGRRKKPKKRRPKKPKKDSLHFAAADLNGLADLNASIDAVDRRVFLVFADKQKPVDVTDRQLKRRMQAIRDDETGRLHRGVAEFAENADCGLAEDSRDDVISGLARVNGRALRSGP